jgi:hypothetical protein
MNIQKSTSIVGTRAQVMHGNAKRTGGGLKKKDLKYNKHGKIVSKKLSAIAKKEKRLQKAGFKTKKGEFKLFRKQRGGANGMWNDNRMGDTEIAKLLATNVGILKNLNLTHRAPFPSMTSIKTIIDTEFQYNHVYKKCYGLIKPKYSYQLESKGDGNCGWRAIYITFFIHILYTRDLDKFDTFIDIIYKSKDRTTTAYPEFIDNIGRLRHILQQRNINELIEYINSNLRLDKEIIMLFRYTSYNLIFNIHTDILTETSPHATHSGAAAAPVMGGRVYIPLTYGGMYDTKKEKDAITTWEAKLDIETAEMISMAFNKQSINLNIKIIDLREMLKHGGTNIVERGNTTDPTSHIIFTPGHYNALIPTEYTTGQRRVICNPFIISNNRLPSYPADDGGGGGDVAHSRAAHGREVGAVRNRARNMHDDGGGGGGAARDAPRAPVAPHAAVSEWTCAACTFVSSTNRNICEMCGAVRHPGGGAGAAPGGGAGARHPVKRNSNTMRDDINQTLIREGCINENIDTAFAVAVEENGQQTLDNIRDILIRTGNYGGGGGGAAAATNIPEAGWRPGARRPNPPAVQQPVSNHERVKPAYPSHGHDDENESKHAPRAAPAPAPRAAPAPAPAAPRASMRASRRAAYVCFNQFDSNAPAGIYKLLCATAKVLGKDVKDLMSLPIFKHNLLTYEYAKDVINNLQEEGLLVISQR